MAKKKEPKYQSRKLYGQDSRDETTLRFTDVSPDKIRMHPTDAKVREDIKERDRSDISRVRKKASEGKGVSKTDRMAYEDAVKRQNRLGTAHEGFDGNTGRGYTLEEGDEQRNRLKKAYKERGYAKGGMVSRGWGCARKKGK